VSGSLLGIAQGDELKPVYARRSKRDDEKTVTAASKAALALKIAAEEADGWHVVKTNKRSVRVAKQKPVDRQLEDDAWCLLYRMGFKELNVDRTFSVQVGPKTPPRQLDVFAKDDETVFIVECTHSRETGPKSVKSLLDKIAAIREEVVKAVHQHYGKEPRLKVKFGIATRNMEWRDTDRVRAGNSGIAIVNDDDLKYFDKLADLLRSAARYQFLGRYLRGEKVEGLRTTVAATKGRMGKVTFYNFLISPHELLKISYISHRASTTNDDIETYQRMVKSSRLKDIGAFIDDGGKFPTNIVVNIKTNGPLRFDRKEEYGDTETGTLHLTGQYGSAWVIDGQHRLYGYSHAERKEESDHSVVPVLAYENLPVRDEIALFVDINTKQVKVSRNLVNEIVSTLNIADADPAKRLDALYARISLRLDAYPLSPVKGRILTVSQEKDHHRCLTLTSLAEGLRENAFLGKVEKGHIQPGGFLSHSSGDPQRTMDKAVATVAQYLNLFAGGVESHWQLGDAKGGYLCTNNGIRALLVLLRRVITFVENRHGVRACTMDPDGIVQYVGAVVSPVVNYFRDADPNEVNAFRTRGSSLLGVNQNCMQMMSIIFESDPAFDLPEVKDFMSRRDVEGTKKAREMIDEINAILFVDVLDKLQMKYGLAKDSWWINGVPKQVRTTCDTQFNDSTGERDRWQFLYFKNYSEIVVHGSNWDLFKDTYNFYGKGKKTDLVRWIGKVNLARTVTHHAEKGPLSKSEVEFVRKVHQLVKTHIEGDEKLILNKNYLPETEAAPVEAAAA
jgi:DNA sulfur modification protein DndB